MRIHRLGRIAVAMLVLSAALVYAQDTGTITGTVRDNTGAVIQGAEVKISGAAGGIQRDTRTNADGDYAEAGLPGGTYNLAITMKGFKTFKGNGVVLRVGQKARVDATLAVGDASTVIEVQGETLTQVETQSSDLTGTVTGKQISQLQLNGRNFTQLLALSPGATNQSGEDEPGQGLSTVAYSVNGGRTEYNNWEIDGGNNMDDGSNTTLLSYPSLDSIAEVRVMSSNYGAQYGRNSSGTVEVETKSGTNKFHGDVFEYVRNDDFNARNYFSPTVEPYKKNDFGFTVGGPVTIPHLYDGKNKTFFFYSQEWRRDRVPGETFYSQVPTCEERGLTTPSSGAGCTGTQAAFGDFSALCPGVDCPINPATGTAFPNNLVPIDSSSGGTAGSAGALPLLALFPYPTSVTSPGYAVYNQGFPSPTNFREELFKIDQNISSKWHANVRYIHDSWNSISPVPLWTDATSYPSIQDAYSSPTTSLVAHLTTTITPNLLNEFVAGYSANHIVMQNVGPWQRPAGYNLGLFQNGFGGGKIPGVILQGGNQYPYGTGLDMGYVPNGPVNSNPSYTYRDNVSKIVGKHNLTMGGYFVASQKNEIPQGNQNPQGVATFSTALTSSTGNPFADFLSGNVYSFTQSSSQPKYYLRYKIFEPYFQDDWRITPRLTLNLGLRISLFGTIYDRLDVPGGGIGYSFDPQKYVAGGSSINTTPGPLFGTVIGNQYNGLVECGKGGIPTGCAQGHLFNPAPRLGFAYDPFGDGKWAIRGGYGIFFEHTNGNEAVATQLEGSPPGVQNPLQSPIGTTYNSSGQIVQSGYSQVGASLGAQYPESGIISLPNQQIWPYVQQFHFDVEHQLPAHIVGIISYVGSKGTHLGNQADINQLKSVAEQGLTNPYKPGEAIGVNDCATGYTPSGVQIPGFNPDMVPGDQSGVGVNMFVACGGNADFFRPYPGFGGIHARFNAASSSYNGLEMSARKTVGALQMSLSYTYSHSIDDASSAADTAFVDSYNFGINRASSNFDQRHVFTASYIYDLPFFKGGGLTHSLLGGWQYSGITSFETGAPFSVTNGGGTSPNGLLAVPADNAGVGNTVGTGSRPDLVGDPNKDAIPAGYTANPSGPLLVNPTAFAAPQGLTYGDTPRNDARNPHIINFDMAMYKHFAIKERMALEFRTEAFNVFNHTEWGYISGNAGSAGGNGSYTGYTNSVGCYGNDGNAGDPSCANTPSSTFLRPTVAHNPRILQLALKFIF
ncbi:MAG: carboxypeptidase regulatory-like domain-containing protein [Terriglobales bacterium]